MSDVKRRVTKLEAQTGGDERFPPGPVIQREGETVEDAARRCGYTEAQIERGGFIVLPEREGRSDEQAIGAG